MTVNIHSIPLNNTIVTEFKLPFIYNKQKLIVDMYKENQVEYKLTDSIWINVTYLGEYWIDNQLITFNIAAAYKLYNINKLDLIFKIFTYTIEQ